MKKHLKSIVAFTAALSMVFSVPMPALADNLYNAKTEEIITKGVTYYYEHRLSTAGWQNIHTLKIDLTADNVEIGPVESSTEYGLKETALKMLSDKGAVAGVNADFFGLKGKYSASFGPVIKDGEIISIGTDKNLTSNEFAAYFMTQSGDSFIDFLKFTADFVNDAGAKLELASINKITELVYPMYFSKSAASSTADIDKRISGLVKMVVENDTITYISNPGEVVQCPDNGYLIIVKDSYADYARTNFKIGDHVSTIMRSSVNLDSIKTAVGGAGRILSNGSVVSEGTIISGRQPRTALGISQDEKTLILMVVDGRGTSIGATHSEMAELLKEYGAYNAMHLDGGGSSTMVAETVNDDKLNVKNTLSEGTQRNIMTALGVFNTSQTGALTQLAFEPSTDKSFVGESVSLTVKGFDDYYNKINVPADQVSYTVTSGAGKINGNTLTATEPGIVSVVAQYNGLTSSADVKFSYPNALTPSVSHITINPGDTISLSFNGMDREGFSAPISPNSVSFTLSNNNLGTINPSNGTFTATNKGTGYITCISGTAICYIGVSVGTSFKTVESFENNPSIAFSSYPDGVTGSTSIVADASEGSKGLQLKYKFVKSDDTQAAYAKFNTPIGLNGTPDKITIAVKGNNSNQWIRGHIIDSTGKTHTIDFTKGINWDGWKDLSATIPSNVSYPIKLEKIYVAALSNTNTNEQSICIDNIRATVADNVADLPANPGFIDSQNVNIDSKVDGSYYITLAGDVVYGSDRKPAEYTNARVKVNEKLQENSDLMIFAGTTDISAPSSVETLKYSSAYKFHNKSANNVSIVELSAKNGGLRNTQASQWQTFTNDIMSAGNTNVIFVMDITPGNFKDTLEGDLLKSAFAKIKDSGKNVYVISTSGTSSWNTVKDGVRYINLPSLWNSDGSINKNFKILTIKVDSNNMYFDLESIF